MSRTLTALGLSAALSVFAAGTVLAEPVAYDIDPSHSAAAFQYSHAGFSTTFGQISGVSGVVTLDTQNPANSAVEAKLDLANFSTGWGPRDTHLLTTGDFFDPKITEITFKSTGVELTGADTAKIAGDLTLNGVTKPVVLDAKLTTQGEYPFPPNQGKPAAGFTATTTIVRSEYGLGMYAPFVSDEVKIDISIEAIAGRTDS